MAADAFDHIYNTARPHQGLPGRLTPATAWEATPKADPPRPKPDRPFYQEPAPIRHPRPKPPADLPADTRIRMVSTAGTITLDSVVYKVEPGHSFEQVLVIAAGNTIIVTDLHGEILAEHTRPAPGTRFVGSGRPPGTRPRKPTASPKS